MERITSGAGPSQGKAATLVIGVRAKRAAAADVKDMACGVNCGAQKVTA